MPRILGKDERVLRMAMVWEKAEALLSLEEFATFRHSNVTTYAHLQKKSFGANVVCGKCSYSLGNFERKNITKKGENQIILLFWENLCLLAGLH